MEIQFQNEPEKITLDEYLERLGLDSSISDYLTDKMKGNRQLKSLRGQKKFDKEAKRAREEYYMRRKEAVKEYNRLVEAGRIIPPTILERTLKKAHGHPDLDSTQAARRILAKRGIDWKTGEKIDRENTKSIRKEAQVDIDLEYKELSK